MISEKFQHDHRHPLSGLGTLPTGASLLTSMSSGGIIIEWKADVTDLDTNWPTNENIVIFTAPADADWGGQLYIRDILMRGLINWNTGANIELNINQAATEWIQPFNISDNTAFTRGHLEAHRDGTFFPAGSLKEVPATTAISIGIDSSGVTGPFSGNLVVQIHGVLLPSS